MDRDIELKESVLHISGDQSIDATMMVDSDTGEVLCVFGIANGVDMNELSVTLFESTDMNPGDVRDAVDEEVDRVEQEMDSDENPFKVDDDLE